MKTHTSYVCLLGMKGYICLLGIPGIGAFLTTAVGCKAEYQGMQHPSPDASCKWNSREVCMCVCWGWDLFFSSSMLHTIGVKFHSFLGVLLNNAGR